MKLIWQRDNNGAANAGNMEALKDEVPVIVNAVPRTIRASLGCIGLATFPSLLNWQRTSTKSRRKKQAQATAAEQQV